VIRVARALARVVPYADVAAEGVPHLIPEHFDFPESWAKTPRPA